MKKKLYEKWHAASRLKKIVVSILFSLLFIFLVLRFLPYSELSDFKQQGWSTRVYDCNNRLLQILPVDDTGLRMEFTPLDKMPPDLVKKIIQAEDKNFYHHCGIDFSAIFRALWQNITSGKKVSGASTITMQLARIIAPARSRTIGAKIIETINALRLELRLSKKQILELYINSVPFGYQTAGFTSAARYFYGSDLCDLTTQQQDNLILVPRNPSLYSPLNRTEVSELGASNKPYQYPFLLPRVIEHIKPQLAGQSEVHLSIDYNLTKNTQYLLQTLIDANKSSRLANGACIVIENATGNVIVWANSSKWNDKNSHGAIDGCLIKMQPGSSMKPFLYALAIEKGYTAATIIPDIPKRFGSYEVYMPQNFNNRYNGPVRLRVALASSLNVPAVTVLDDLGIFTYLQKLDELEFNSLKNTGPECGLSLALGSGEIQLAELVRAFSVFPNDGLLRKLQFITDKTDFKGEILDYTDSATDISQSSIKQIYTSDTARLICSILSDADARELGFGRAHTFITDFPSIFKTGTSNQYQNITALAASPEYTVGVWMGNFDGNTVIGKTGSSIPAQVAKQLLIELHKQTTYPKTEWAEPKNYVKCKICPLSGMKAGPDCLATLEEFIPTMNADNLPTCNWHQGSKIHYPAEYQEWFFDKQRNGTLAYNDSELNIIQPTNGNIFIFDNSTITKQIIPLQVTGGTANILHVMYDGQFYADIERPFTIDIPMQVGEHQIEVQCGDDTQIVTFKVE